MTKRFDDCFYGSYIEVRKNEGKPYVTITAESNDEWTQIFLGKNDLKQLIEHLQKIHSEI